MSAPLWTSAELAAATGGRARGAWSVEGVSIDSRTIRAQELFIALRGPHHDGHDFVAAALQAGAAALVDRLPAGVDPASARLVEVEDTLQALTALGRAARARSKARIAAITGSVGKTGTKEALRLALAAQAPTHASAASYNNHWGVPLSLARQPRDAAYGVYELGMSAVGEIAALAALVRPQVALITRIAPAHLGFFPSIAAIAEAKGEIFGGLEPGGVAVLNLDDPHSLRLRQLTEAAGCARVIGFGSAAGAAVRLREARLEPDRSEVVALVDGAEIAYRVGAPGRHWVANSLGVLACVLALGADPAAAAHALAGFRAPKGRGARHLLRRPGGPVTLIDESYNANPVSMRAALELLAAAPGRRLAALGDMLELGGQAAALHEALAEPLAAAGAERVFTVGAAMRHLHAALPAARRGAHVERAEQLLPLLEAELRPGDTLLVKGSLGSGMGRLVAGLLAAPALVEG
jgi:UDP-N-acetylmuramoyl-tripeptide--D-alanyl-D-alanine ligase